MINYEKIKLEIEDKFKDIDDLITTLLALSEPEPKYKVGDKVWYIDLPVNQIHSSIIIKVNNDEYAVDGSINGTKDDFIESELYPTKADLIEAQIAYWTTMREPEKFQHQWNHGELSPTYCSRFGVGPDCQHETVLKIKPYKCIKCGEFYR